jgi:hypothetical protein
MQLDLTVLTNTKEKRSTSANCSDTVVKALSTYVSIDLMQVDVPAEDGSQQLAIFTYALKGSSTFISTHAPNRLALL